MSHRRFSLVTRLLPSPRALYVRLHGVVDAASSAEFAERLARRLEAEGAPALIMDYRRCTLTHTPEQFDALARRCAERFPARAACAYLYRRGQGGHVVVMLDRLARAGFSARAFESFPDARDWLTSGARMRPALTLVR